MRTTPTRTITVDECVVLFFFFSLGVQHLLSAALSEVAAKASTNCGPAFIMSFPCYAKGVERRASAITSSKVASGKWKQMKGKRSIKMYVDTFKDHGLFYLLVYLLKRTVYAHDENIS